MPFLVSTVLLRVSLLKRDDGGMLLENVLTLRRAKALSNYFKFVSDCFFFYLVQYQSIIDIVFQNHIIQIISSSKLSIHSLLTTNLANINILME